MRFKKTRIAISVVCGVLCVLLIGLWIRSQSTADFIEFRVNSTWGGQAGTVLGSAVFFISDTLYVQHSWMVGSRPCSKSDMPSSYSTLWGKFGFSSAGGIGVDLPCWFLVLLTGMVAGAVFPYRHVQWRFSLKTLLIFTTFISLALGLIIYIAKT